MVQETCARLSCQNCVSGRLVIKRDFYAVFTVELWRYIVGSFNKNVTDTCGQWKYFDGLYDRISTLCGSASKFCLCVACSGGKFNGGFGIPKDELFDAS